ncbi:hypothetical protein [Hyphomicrobium sp.]|jgi:hypothetical protein|uniref:hypothetical protein n=1 Tax=Hyphomicrobium sp. TaxID=82 RepID=UPI0035664F8F
MTQHLNHLPRHYLGKSPIVCNAILSALRSGKNITTAARIVGLARSTILVWRKADPEFDRAVSLAKEDGIAKVVADRLRGIDHET